MTKTDHIRKELASLKTKLIISGLSPNVALNQAQMEMNKKYGKDWREELPKFQGRSNDLYFK